MKTPFSINPLVICPLWAMLLSVQLFASRLMISMGGTPPGFGSVENSARVTALDLPIVLVLSICISFPVGNRVVGRIKNALFLVLIIVFFGINTANATIHAELGRLISIYDFGYMAQTSFLKGSFVRSLFSGQVLFLFFIPSVLSFLIRVFTIPAPCRRRRMLLFVSASVLITVFARKWGFDNPVPRRYSSSCSVYSHSFPGAVENPKPLSQTERSELLRLRKQLFFRDSEAVCRKSEKMEQPNVVIIVLESFNSVYIDSVIQDITVTPVLNGLKKEGVYFPNAFSNSYMTSRALWSILTGELELKEGMVFRRIPEQKTPFLTDYLHAQGYTNSWFHGNTSLFDNRSGVFNTHHFDHVIDSDSFPPPIEKVGWGISDCDFFENSITFFDRLAKSEAPFFAAMLTLTNHHPYEIPEGFSLFKASQSADHRYLNGVHYTDYALGRFFELISNKEWFDNTVFIVTADNGAKPDKPVKDILRDIDHFFRIPLLILGPGVPEGEDDLRLASHMDIASTVYQVVSGDQRRIGVGSSLLCGTDRGWGPVTGTFFGSFIYSSKGVVLRSQEGECDQFGSAVDCEQLRLLEQYQDLWGRFVLNGDQLGGSSR
ncbi:MAG: LTA synthase family protein [Chitinispirillaceae bacterium]